MARRSSPALQAARAAVAAAEGRERQAGAFANPVLAYGREQTSRGGETNSQNTLTLEQRLELGGQRGARRSSAELLRKAAEAHLLAVSAELDAQVARAYTGTITAQRRALLAENAARAFARAHQISEARFARGDVSGFAHRRLGLEVARYQALRLAAFLERDSSTTTLGGLLGLAALDAAPFPELTDTMVPAPLRVSVDSLLNTALAVRPDLLAAQFEAEAGLAETRLASAERVPTPSLIGGFKNERVTTGETLAGFVAGLAIPLPLWDGRKGSVAAARSEANRRSADVESLRRLTVVEVRNAYATDAALGTQLATLRQQLGQEAQAARVAADASYEEGEISLLEWLDAVRAYYEAETAYLNLWAEHVRRRVALEQLSGLPLF
jgi:cobalt-zinc-cadmium efflux system outer membrane protein